MIVEWLIVYKFWIAFAQSLAAIIVYIWYCFVSQKPIENPENQFGKVQTQITAQTIRIRIRNMLFYVFARSVNHFLSIIYQLRGLEPFREAFSTN